MKNDIDNWNNLAKSWDEKMGNEGNRWHRQLIMQQTIELLHLNKNDTVLEIGCGNGSFANELSKLGARVIATDFSDEMIKYAKRRWKDNCQVEFEIVDATIISDILKAGMNKNITKVVSNMAIMDISNIDTMFAAVGHLLDDKGLFVFSSVHPCFQNPGMEKIIEYNDYNDRPTIRKGIKIFNYIRESIQKTLILANSEKTAIHYHRPLSVVVKCLSENSLVLDAIEEPVFKSNEDDHFEWSEIPPVIIYRAKKSA